MVDCIVKSWTRVSKSAMRFQALESSCLRVLVSSSVVIGAGFPGSFPSLLCSYEWGPFKYNTKPDINYGRISTTVIIDNLCLASVPGFAKGTISLILKCACFKDQYIPLQHYAWSKLNMSVCRGGVTVLQRWCGNWVLGVKGRSSRDFLSHQFFF